MFVFFMTKLSCSVLGWQTIWCNVDTKGPRYGSAGFLLVLSQVSLLLLSAWAATDISEELSLESRFESEMGSRTASPAISNSSVSIGLCGTLTSTDCLGNISPHATSPPRLLFLTLSESIQLLFCGPVACCEKHLNQMYLVVK